MFPIVGYAHVGFILSSFFYEIGLRFAPSFAVALYPVPVTPPRFIICSGRRTVGRERDEIETRLLQVVHTLPQVKTPFIL